MRLDELVENRPDVDPELGPAVRRRRETLGWSRGRLAEAVNVSEVYVKKIEASERQPSGATLLRLQHVLVSGEAPLRVKERQHRTRLPRCPSCGSRDVARLDFVTAPWFACNRCGVPSLLTSQAPISVEDAQRGTAARGWQHAWGWGQSAGA